jgi:hypothetical protein
MGVARTNWPRTIPTFADLLAIPSPLAAILPRVVAAMAGLLGAIAAAVLCGCGIRTRREWCF